MAFEDLDLADLRRRRSEKWRRYPADVLPAWIAEMDYDLAEPVAHALLEAIGRGDCGYANETGVGEAFAAFAAARHDWSVDPGQVRLIADVMSGVDAVLRLVTRPGDGVVINPPVYPPFFEHIRARGRTVVHVPLVGGAHRWELDVGGLEAAFAAGARAYLLCSPHNPTGRVFTAEELARIAWLAAKYEVTVISDEIHAPLTLAGARHVPFVTVGPGVGVTLASASKAFNIPGLKCAVMTTAPGPMTRVIAALPESAMYAAGLLGVLASEAAWRDGGPWLDRLVGELDVVRREFGKMLAERLPGAVYLPPEAGYLAWVDVSALELGPEPAEVFLERGRIALGRGLDFGPPGDGYVRVTIGTSTAILSQIVDRMVATTSRL